MHLGEASWKVKGILVLAAACITFSIVYLACTLTFSIMTQGIYFPEYFTYNYLFTGLFFTITYPIMRYRTKPRISNRKILAHVLFVDLIMLPLGISNMMLGTGNIFNTLVFVGIVLVIWLICYFYFEFNKPPSQRGKNGKHTPENVAFCFPALAWSVPIVLLTMELAIFGYWIGANAVKLATTRKRSLAIVIVATCLVLSPMIFDQTIIKPETSPDITYDVQSGISMDIIPFIEGLNLISLFNCTGEYLGEHANESLGAIKASFLSEPKKDNPFTFTWGIGDERSYEFKGRIYSTGVNLTYWIDASNESYAIITTLETPSRIIIQPYFYANLFINQSHSPLPSSIHYSKLYAVPIIFVNVEIHRDIVCGSLCGSLWMGNAWFLIGPLSSILAASYFCYSLAAIS